jgi:hypothetical protein
MGKQTMKNDYDTPKHRKGHTFCRGTLSNMLVGAWFTSLQPRRRPNITFVDTNKVLAATETSILSSQAAMHNV